MTEFEKQLREAEREIHIKDIDFIIHIFKVHKKSIAIDISEKLLKRREKEYEPKRIT